MKQIVKKSKFTKLGQAEIIITGSLEFALALKYTSGQIPQVIVSAKNDAFAEIVWHAQELGIPIVENIFLNKETFEEFKEGHDIPNKFYEPVAQSLALIYKGPAKPKPVKYIKILTKLPLEAKKEINTLYKKHEDCFKIYPVEVRLGKSLYQKKELYEESFKNLRQKIILDLGIILPEFKISEGSNTDEWEFTIYLKEIPYLTELVEAVPGRQENLLKVTHKLKQTIYQNAADLLGYSEVEAYLKSVEKENKTLIKELFPEHFSITSLKSILKGLLREQISIRNLGTILEVIKENLALTSDVDTLTEYIRSAFKKYLYNKYKDENDTLNVILLDHKVEKLIASSLKVHGKNIVINLSPEEGLKILTQAGSEIKKAQNLNIKPVILSSPNLRRFVRRITEHTFYDVPVMAYSEISPQTKVNSTGTISIKT